MCQFSKLLQIAVLHSSVCPRVFAATWTLRPTLASTSTSTAVGGGMLATLWGLQERLHDSEHLLRRIRNLCAM